MITVPSKFVPDNYKQFKISVLDNIADSYISFDDEGKSNYYHKFQKLINQPEMTPANREVRLPYLFHELCEFIISLPSDYKIRNGWTKWIQRKSLESIMPQKITWRTDKIGYEPPQKKWMEDNYFVELIHENKRKLYDNKVISVKAYNKPVKSAEANSKVNYNWEYLMAGNLFK